MTYTLCCRLLVFFQFSKRLLGAIVPWYQQVLSVTTAPTQDVCAQTFSQWTHMENLKISTYTPHLITMIIGSSVFDRLTRLYLGFHKVANIRHLETPFVIKPILQDIANLPALKLLELVYAKGDLEDVEKLHDDVSKLEDISFIALN